MDSDKAPDELGSSLHLRLMAGDPTASAEIAEIYFHLLQVEMSYNIQHEADPHLAEQAIIDALTSYLSRPEQYDPSRNLSLLAYLKMSAGGDLANARDSAARRARREIDPHGFVANSDHDSEQELEYADDTDVELLVTTEDSDVFRLIDSLFESPQDRIMVELMMEGVRSTEPYAIVLEITQAPPQEQARIVKQHKDRIKARLRRNLDPERIRAEARGDD